MKRIGTLLLFIIISVTLLSCRSQKLIKYYADQSNYITTTGNVIHLKYNEEMDTLYLAFTGIDDRFSDNNFKVVGDSLLIVQKNGIDEKLEVGDTVTFTAAPRYFGDGYVVPLVELATSSEILLSFDEGFDNLQVWLSE